MAGDRDMGLDAVIALGVSLTCDAAKRSYHFLEAAREKQPKVPFT